MAEWFKASVLKIEMLKNIIGSNPILSDLKKSDDFTLIKIIIMKKLVNIIYNILTPKFFLNSIWHKQIFRKYFYNTKNIFFNEFIIANILDTNLLEQYKKNNRSEINIPTVKLLNSDLWSNYVLLWRHEEHQRLLDNLFMKSRYFRKLEDISYNKKSNNKNNNLKYNLDLSLWYQLGYSIDLLNEVNSNLDFNKYFNFNRSTLLLEESLEYQHKLNTHLVGVFDYLSSLYEKDMFIQSKTFRGIFLRFFREILYPWFSSIAFTFMTVFSVISELLYLISSFIAIPLLFILFFYLILTDAVTNFDLETVWLQINFFEFLYNLVSFYNPQSLLVDDLSLSIYFNNFCWFCIYLFFFFMLIFEGAAWLGILIGEEDSTSQDVYTDEGTIFEDISESCQLRVLELMLELADTDFTNIDYNNYYIFSENSDEFRDIEGGFSDLNQFALQLFGGGIGILYMMQLVIDQDDIDDDEWSDLQYYEGVTRQNEDVENDPELEFGSFLSYNNEADSSFGLYEYPLDAGEIHFNRYHDDHMIFDEEGSNIEGFVASNGVGFDIFSENSVNYFFEYIIGISIFDFILLLLILLYTIIYFKIYYDWEVWVYREYAAREYFQRITYLGWQHSLSNDEIISDEDIINNVTILEQTSYNIAGNEQLNFSRDIDPHVTDIEFFFEDLETIIDFKNDFFIEDDYEFIDQDEFDAIFDSLEAKAIDYEDVLVDGDKTFIESDNFFNTNYKEKDFKLNLDAFGSMSNINFFDLYKNIKLLILNNKNNLNYLTLCKQLLQLSPLFIYVYKNLNKITNPLLKNQLLFLIYFNINFRKMLLKNSLININNLSNIDILLLNIEIQQEYSSQLVLKIQDEIVELLIDDNLSDNLSNYVDDFIEDLILENDLNDEYLFSHDFLALLDFSYVYFNMFKNVLNSISKYKNYDYYNPLNVYSSFFQINLIGNDNFFILDEENDIQFFFEDFEDDIEYFNQDTADVDLTTHDDVDEVNIEEDNLDQDFESLSDDETNGELDDLLPDTVYNDDENPYDLFSYDFFFKNKLKFTNVFQENHNFFNLFILKKKFIILQNFLGFENYNEKQYSKFYNNFCMYVWSTSDLENNIGVQSTLYNVTNILDLEFDTNYVEIDDDELYDDEHFLVPTQRLLLQSLVNNYRYEYTSWLDGWGTWSFLNYNKFEGTLHTFFDYEAFEVDEEADVDEEDMIEMNLIYFLPRNEFLEDLNDDPTDFVDAVPELTTLFDDLDDFEEDLVEISYLVEKPYVYLIIFILIFECGIIFFIEYYFVFFIFLEPENGDNLISDFFDFRYTGIFFDILKLKTYSIYLFILEFLTIENNFFNEIKMYQLIYNSIFCYLDEPTSVGTQYTHLQNLGQQRVVLYFLEFYETYIVKLLNYFEVEELGEEESEEATLSSLYYEAYCDQKRENNAKNLSYFTVQFVEDFITEYTYFFYYLYYSCYETYLEFLEFMEWMLQLFVNFFFVLAIICHYIYLQILILIYYFLSFPYFIYDNMIFLYGFIVYCILFGNILEIINFFPENLNFNNYVFSFLLFIWRFNYFTCIGNLDYILYIIYNYIVINFFDFICFQVYSILDFLHIYKKIIFVQNLYYTYTYQYVLDNVVKQVVMTTKPLIKMISFFEILIIQFYLAQKNLYIIVDHLFSYFLSFFFFEQYFYLFINILLINISKIYLVIFLILFLLFKYVITMSTVLFLFCQVYNYDLFFVYFYFICSLMIYFVHNIYYITDYFNYVKLYTINRHSQFDDKDYYNNETMLNFYPEVLYDIETLTFINNSFDSYLYWY